MAEKLEQIDYGGRPERMDPKLEKKLKDPEGLYSKNPAMKKGTKDVQRLVSSRFNKVAEKLRSVTGLDSLNANQVQRFYMQMMSNIPVIMNIESNNREALQNLAVKASLDETEVPENWVKIIPELGSPIDTSNFRYEPEDTEEEGDEEEKLPKKYFLIIDRKKLSDNGTCQLSNRNGVKYSYSHLLASVLIWDQDFKH